MHDTIELGALYVVVYRVKAAKHDHPPLTRRASFIMDPNGRENAYIRNEQASSRPVLSCIYSHEMHAEMQLSRDVTCDTVEKQVEDCLGMGINAKPSKVHHSYSEA